MNITTLIMIFILLAVFVVMVIISRNKALKAQSNNANADENNEGDDASVNPKAVPNVKYYKIEDPELAHVFSVRANRVLGISEIIHSFFIFAFLFFPIDILRIDTLFEALTDFFSDPLDEILKPAPFLAIIFVFWGCFNLFSGVYSLIKSNSPDFTFSAFDYAAFASKCTDSGASRVLFCISSSVLCFSFWLYALLMLNVNLLDAWVPMLTLLAYIFI